MKERGNMKEIKTRCLKWIDYKKIFKSRMARVGTLR